MQVSFDPFAAPVTSTNGTSLSIGGLDVVLVPERRRKAALHMLELRVRVAQL